MGFFGSDRGPGAERSEERTDILRAVRHEARVLVFLILPELNGILDFLGCVFGSF